MTFGIEWGWGTPEETARKLFDRFLDAGGNFFDTADGYTAGKSEELLGKFVRDAKVRDKAVIATKFTFNGEAGNPNAGGNGRKNILRALEGSLRRLQTDYIDLYYLHAWDGVTPVEEVLDTLDTLVRSGKIRYFGLSNAPAWYVGRMVTLAQSQGKAAPIGLQMEYSLVERTIEREFVPAALELGLGILPWSPLSSGFLSGKYERTKDGGKGEGRLEKTKGSANPNFKRFTPRNWRILEALLAVAKELGKSPAQVALNWITKRPGVTSTIIGATKLAQLEDNLSALEFEIPRKLWANLEKASKPRAEYPYVFYDEFIRAGINGQVPVRKEPRWFR
jgi:aryl-alcohol dehydrogenase-like predicted oxidoreductase